jgi:hypothetical protein
MKTEDYKVKLDTRDELLARILDAASRIKIGEAKLKRKKNVIFARELQSTLSLTVEFSKIYYKL